MNANVNLYDILTCRESHTFEANHSRSSLLTLIRWSVAFLSLFSLTSTSCSQVSSLLLSSVQVSPWRIYWVPPLRQACSLSSASSPIHQLSILLPKLRWETTSLWDVSFWLDPPDLNILILNLLKHWWALVSLLCVNSPLSHVVLYIFLPVPTTRSYMPWPHSHDQVLFLCLILLTPRAYPEFCRKQVLCPCYCSCPLSWCGNCLSSISAQSLLGVLLLNLFSTLLNSLFFFFFLKEINKK